MSHHNQTPASWWQWVLGVPILASLLVAAGGLVDYFWRRITGRFIPNISIQLECSRTPRAIDGLNDLVVTIKLSKHYAPAVIMRTLRAELFLLKPTDFDHEIVPRSSDEQPWKPDPNNRSLNARGGYCQTVNVLAIWTSQRHRSLNLAPGESTEYATYFIVQPNEACEIIVTLTGIEFKLKKSRRAQSRIDANDDVLFWTASAVSVSAQHDMSVDT
jgi:hypothetical protein